MLSGSDPSMGGPLVVVGDVVTDIVCHTQGPWRHGTDATASIAIRPGGSAANTAAWSASFGLPTVLVGRVGADDAAWHRELLENVGVEPRLTVDERSPTTRLVALIDESGERTMLTDRGANLHLCTDDLRLLQGVSKPAWFHLSGYLLFAPEPQFVFSEVKRWCVANRVGWSVDPASVGFLSELGRKEARSLLSGATLGFPNEDEARWLADVPSSASILDVSAALRTLWDTVIITRGAQGIAVNDQMFPAHPIAKVIDSVGAGDAFAGGWLAAHLGGASSSVCVAQALLAASQALAQMGGRPVG